MKILLSSILIFLSCSCAVVGTSTYQTMTSGIIGCHPSDIKIYNHQNILWAGQGTNGYWEAECKDKRYRCSFSGAAQCANFNI